MVFADFDTVEHAQEAIDCLKARADLGKLLVSFASSKVERTASNRLFLRMGDGIRSRTVVEMLRELGSPQHREVERRELRLVSFAMRAKLRSIGRGTQETSANCFIVTFASQSEATSALMQIRSDKRCLEGFYYHPRPVRRPPSNILVIRKLPQNMRYNSLLELFSSYPGYRKLIVGK